MINKNFFLNIHFYLLLLTLILTFNVSKSQNLQDNSIQIIAKGTMEWFQLEKKIVASGNAEVKSKDFVILANNITGLYEGEIGNGNIKNLIAKENASINTPQGIINAEYINYDFHLDKITVKGDKIFMNFDQGTINANNNLVFDKKENHIKVAGDAKILINGKGEINAQKITILIDKKGNIEIVEAYKDVKILLNLTQQKITSNEAKFDNKNLQINLLGDVTLKQGKNFLKGDSAILDLDKGTSKILSTTTNSVSGVFY